MDKKKTIDAEEQALFKEAVKNVKPLGGNKRFLSKPPVAPIIHRPSLADIQPYPLINLDDLAPQNWVGIEEQISFHHSGLQNKLLKKLAQGKISIDARVDLHRMTMTLAWPGMPPMMTRRGRRYGYGGFRDRG